jgi:hypothetical protein
MTKSFFPRDAPRRRSGRGRSGRWGRRGRRRGARGSRRTTGTLPAPSRAPLSAGAAPPPPGAPSPGTKSSVVVTAARAPMGLDPIRRLRGAVGRCVLAGQRWASRCLLVILFSFLPSLFPRQFSPFFSFLYY